jgi:hypothetical protein
MKHIINYLGTLLAVVLISATFTACSENDDNGSANVGLGIKVFSPTKVVTNQPMTINGSGFSAATEIEFPGGVKVSNFEIVSDDMIRVNAPSGISAEGGKIIVRTASEETESRLPLTIGHTNVTGFSKQPGETANGGEQITVFGSDLEFVNAVELLDAEGNTLLIDHKDFYRKGTSNLIFTLPKFNIYKGTFVGYIYTFDGQKIPMPELSYEPAATGHWESQEIDIWKGEEDMAGWGNNWSVKAQWFADQNVAVGEKIRIYLDVYADNAQVKVESGEWSAPPIAGLPADQIFRKADLSPEGYWEFEIDDAILPWLLNGDSWGHGDALILHGEGCKIVKITVVRDVWVEEGEGGPSEYDIKLFTVYQNQGGNTEPTLEYPYKPSWSDDSGKIRIMRGMGDPSLENLGLTTSSKFVVYKEVGTKGQIQFNNPNWGDLNAGCNDWAGDKETIEVPITEDMLKCINGEISDGWSNTALILQGDGLTVTKIVIVP